MHILLTNNTLDHLSGSELYVYDLACEYRQRGHQVSCFSLKLGLVAERLKEAGITVTDDLSRISAVDIIHGHHPLESRIAAAFFPNTPVVFVSHGKRNELERPGKDSYCFTRYVAVSEEVKQSLLERDNIPDSKIDVVLNFADLKRFTASRPCPPVPRRVVALSNHNTSTIESQIVKSACDLAGLELRVIGMGINSVWEVEDQLDWADVVVAAARSAIQAMAMGRPTVVFKYTGGDGLVTPGNFDQLALTNFGGRTYRHQYTPEQLAAELTRYDLAEVAEVQRRVRDERSLTRAADKYLQIYDQAMSEFKQSWPAPEANPRLEAVLRDLGTHLATFKEADLWRDKGNWGLLRYSELESQLRERNAQLDNAVNDRKYYEADRKVLEEYNTALQKEREILEVFNLDLQREKQVLEEYNTDLQRERQVLEEYNSSLQAKTDKILLEVERLQAQARHLSAENNRLNAELSKAETLLEQVNNGRVLRLFNAVNFNKARLKAAAAGLTAKLRAR